MQSTSEASTVDDAKTGFMGFIGALFTLVVLVAAILVIFWQSYQEWGTLPSVGGSGFILYGGVTVAVVASSVYVIWAWHRWRDSLP